MLSEEELEELEKPDPKLVFTPHSPQTFLDGLQRVEQKEAAEELKKLAEFAANEADVEARIKSAVMQAVEEEKAKNTAANSSSSETENAPVSNGNSNIDWGKAAVKNITLFYPGQASFEWIQSGRDHGGARAFLKGGDRCATCHLKEVKDMGAKIVSGEKLEPTPIAGKRGHIDVKMQATHGRQKIFICDSAGRTASIRAVPFRCRRKNGPEKTR